MKKCYTSSFAKEADSSAFLVNKLKYLLHKEVII